MAIITNKGRLINDLPLANVIGETDSLVIQTSNSTTNRTERILFGTLKSFITDLAADLSNYESVVNFTAPQNKYTGSFYSPDGGTTDLYKTTVRNNLEVLGNISTNNTLTITNGNLNLSLGGIISNGIINNGTFQSNTLDVVGAASVNGTLTTDTIYNSFNITTDTIQATTVNTSFLNASNININNVISAKGVGAQTISGSLSGSLISKNARATGSFYGKFNGGPINSNTITAHTLVVDGTSVSANNAIITANQFTELGDGFNGTLLGDVEDLITGKTCLTTDGTIPPAPSTVARFFGTASYCLKSDQTNTLSFVPDQAKTSSYLNYTDGINNGTAYKSITAVSANTLNTMYMLTRSILLTSSLPSQLPSLNVHPSPIFQNDNQLPSPLTGSWSDTDVKVFSLKNALYLITSSYTNKIIPKYMLITAELIGTAPTPDLSTEDYVIENPHYAKLYIIPSDTTPFDEDAYVDERLKHLNIPFLRNDSIASCVSQKMTFTIKVPTNNNLFEINTSAYISSSAGKEITSKANAQYLWKYNLYLDGVL